MTFLKVISVATAGFIAICGTAAAQTRTVKIASEGAYPPWNITQPDGKLGGFEIELAQNLCERMKVKCEISAQEWDGLIPGMNVGKYDAIMAGMSITEERLKAIDFSIPYAREPNGFMVEKGTKLADMPGAGKVINLDKDEAEAIKVLNEIKPLLKGRTLGVQISTTHSLLADKYLKGAVEVKQYKSTPEHDLDLSAGRIDIVLADRSTLDTSLATPELKNFTHAGPMFVGGVVGNGVGVGLRKGDKELKALFDAAIKSAIEDGTVQKLSEKWFHADNTPRD
ncbi:lysine/arginine/ornithine ABC transporter substrate-binding protein [Microvirga sp. W0021]|uniref:Lysine/arginine/ornithine ABC transporter substrate-binding protein n=1 Tax=Hohaiivirga grylli TaxID=3133970 RepID=A0ABV0BJE1_9HYPH